MNQGPRYVRLMEKSRGQKSRATVPLNIQSLPDKFNEFSEMIRFFQTKNCSPDIVCLQELWEFPDHTLLIIPGYENLLYKLRCNNVQGGGVGIYVKSGFKSNHFPLYSIFVDRVFESIFTEI